MRIIAAVLLLVVGTAATPVHAQNVLERCGFGALRCAAGVQAEWRAILGIHQEDGTTRYGGIVYFDAAGQRRILAIKDVAAMPMADLKLAAQEIGNTFDRIKEAVGIEYARAWESEADSGLFNARSILRDAIQKAKDAQDTDGETVITVRNDNGQALYSGLLESSSIQEMTARIGAHARAHMELVERGDVLEKLSDHLRNLKKY